jgi:hypothetical protein
MTSRLEPRVLFYHEDTKVHEGFAKLLAPKAHSPGRLDQGALIEPPGRSLGDSFGSFVGFASNFLPIRQVRAGPGARDE